MRKISSPKPSNAICMVSKSALEIPEAEKLRLVAKLNDRSIPLRTEVSETLIPLLINVNK